MEKKKILILSPLDEGIVENLMAMMAGVEFAKSIEYETFRGETPQELVEAVSSADVILGDYTNRKKLSARVIENAKRCVLIQQPSVGYQDIDIEQAAKMGIPVANVAGANSVPVAEHTVMLALACLKKLLTAHDKTKNGQWAQDEMAQYGIFELNGKTVGIVGMGRIGKEVSKRLDPFGVRIIYYDKMRLDENQEKDLGVTYCPLDELVSNADIITLHVPLTDETRKLIDKRRISMMKPNAILINVARGEVVDEDALAEALARGKIGGAALDVFVEEPPSPSSAILNAPNVILTPHIAGATNEARLRIITASLQNIKAALEGSDVVNIVNGIELKKSAEQCSPGTDLIPLRKTCMPQIQFPQNQYGGQPRSTARGCTYHESHMRKNNCGDAIRSGY